MRKTLFINIAKLIASLIIFFFIFGFVSRLLIKENDAFKRRDSFDSLPQNSIDIMFIGNSHSYTAFIPEKVHEITGMTVYNAAMPSQVLDMVWYNFELALKKQSPKIVVLEAFAFQDPTNRDVFNDANIDSMPYGITKLSAIFDIYKSPKDRFQLLFSVYRHHGNWSDVGVLRNNLKAMLFGKNYSYVENGGYYQIESRMTPETVEKLKNLTPSDYVYKAKVTEYNKMYFEKINDECVKRGIKLIAVMAPMNKNYVQKTNYDSVHQDFKALFDSKGVDFIDYNLLYNDINMTDEDFANESHTAHHVNYSGAVKISEHFSKYLTSISKKK